MRSAILLLFLFISIILADDDEVKITILFKPDGCASSRRAKEGDIVFVHYTGKFKDDSVFDSSEGRDPFQFTIGRSGVIEGWHEGIQGMCVGEQRILRIPPSKAYGSVGVKGRIPPQSTLIFEVNLVSFDEAPLPTGLDRLSSIFLAFGILSITYYVIKNNLNPTPPANNEPPKREREQGKRTNKSK